MALDTVTHVQVYAELELGGADARMAAATAGSNDQGDVRENSTDAMVPQLAKAPRVTIAASRRPQCGG
jgi:hypothetical protein